MRILISDAVAHVGTKAALARLLGISTPAVVQWPGPYMPPDRAKTLVERLPACKQYVEPEPPSEGSPLWP